MLDGLLERLDIQLSELVDRVVDIAFGTGQAGSRALSLRLRKLRRRMQSGFRLRTARVELSGLPAV
ncbi:hypothetical protein [Actinosynnema sp. NPDC023587]|uniref:hypothetical protein n=1 Tax=Actinosynnema sp. NPDC023587 TaxID=3154695 RepID=UPI0033F31813